MDRPGPSTSRLPALAGGIRTGVVAEDSGGALEASIQSQGLLQNVVVFEAIDGFYDVTVVGCYLCRSHR